MSFFKKLKNKLFKSSSKIDEGLDAIVNDGGEEEILELEAPDNGAAQAGLEAEQAAAAQAAQEAEAARIAEQERLAEEARVAEEARLAEQARLDAIAVQEEEEARQQAEAARLAEEEKQADLARQREEERAREAEAEKARLAEIEEQAELERQRDAESARAAELAAEAEAERKRAEAAEADRQAQREREEAERAAEAERQAKAEAARVAEAERLKREAEATRAAQEEQRQIEAANAKAAEEARLAAEAEAKEVAAKEAEAKAADANEAETLEPITEDDIDAFADALEEQVTEAAETPPEKIIRDAVVAPMTTLAPSALDEPTEEEPVEKKGLLGRIFGGKEKKTIVRRTLDDDMLEQLEELLITADMGVDTALRVTANMAEGNYGKKLSVAEIKGLMAREIARIMEGVARPMPLYAKKPQVVLVVGVNGSGKTTTIGKLASQFKAAGKTVVIAAGDTFRAAAVEQLQVWGDRAGVPVLTAPEGSDPASLAYDAMEKASQDGADLLMIDTAGRLQNRADLMEELTKIVRVIRKKDPDAPHNTLLVLDATTGQNALNQVKVFQELADVSGLVMTKLDGTAKGGVLVALADKFGLPIHAIGVGEQLDDLSPFDPEDFANALVGLDR